MGLCDKYNKVCGEYIYVFFRVVVGLFFAIHGAQKLFGLLGMSVQSPWSLMFFAGLIELVVGAMVLTGFYVRMVSKIGALHMVVAYFMAHAGNGLIPLANGGEPALLFLVSFLIMSYQGAGDFSLEKMIFKKETF